MIEFSVLEKFYLKIMDQFDDLTLEFEEIMGYSIPNSPVKGRPSGSV